MHRQRSEDRDLAQTRREEIVSGLFLPDDVSYLPDSDDGVADQDEQDDEGLDEGRDGVVVVLEEGQDLKEGVELTIVSVDRDPVWV